jgi:hypothetical protein
VGTVFNNSYYDTNFWTKTETNGGTVTFDGDATLTTSTNTAGYASLRTVRKARFVPGSANVFKSSIRLTTDAVADNTRRFGAYDANNGVFFELDGTTFKVGYRKATSDTTISNGSFNGDFGATIVFTTAIYKFEIEYGTNAIFWYINGTLLHKVGISTASLCQTLELPITIETENTGSAVDNGILLFNTSIFRVGQLKTNPTSKWIDGANTGIQLKYGGGILHRVVVLDNQGTISIYDGTSAADTQLAFIDCTKVQGSIDFDIPFSDGLFFVTTDPQHSSVTVYE